MEEDIIKALKEIQSLPIKIKAMVLNTYLLEDKQINSDLEAELAVISAKYKNLAKPLVDRVINLFFRKFMLSYVLQANEIINGTIPSEQDLKGLNDYVTAEEAQKKDESIANIKPIEDYWLTVLKNSVVMSKIYDIACV